MLIPGEAEIVSMAAKSALEALTGQAKSARPDTREALIALHDIVFEWERSAQATSRFVNYRLFQRSTSDTELRDYVKDHAREFERFRIQRMGGSNVGYAYTRKINRAIINSMIDQPPLIWRWNPGARRTAGRRGLRAVLRVYSPDLVKDFERTVDRRKIWVRSYRRKFRRQLERGPTQDIIQICNEMRETADALTSISNRLREFISANYPLV